MTERSRQRQSASQVQDEDFQHPKPHLMSRVSPSYHTATSKSFQKNSSPPATNKTETIPKRTHKRLDWVRGNIRLEDRRKALKIIYATNHKFFASVKMKLSTSFNQSMKRANSFLLVRKKGLNIIQRSRCIIFCHTDHPGTKGRRASHPPRRGQWPQKNQYPRAHLNTLWTPPHHTHHQAFMKWVHI